METQKVIWFSKFHDVFENCKISVRYDGKSDDKTEMKSNDEYKERQTEKNDTNYVSLLCRKGHDT